MEIPEQRSWNAGRRLGCALRLCEKAQLRITRARKLILSFLATQRLPVTLDDIAQAEQVYGAIDAATVYRSLMLLSEAEVVRQLSIGRKTHYFALGVPGETCCYLVCRCCGSIVGLARPEGLFNLEEEAKDRRGYVAVYHELELRGICPRCQKEGHWPVPCAKLPVRAEHRRKRR